jgi:hypothetical protein
MFIERLRSYLKVKDAEVKVTHLEYKNAYLKVTPYTEVIKNLN